MRQKHSASLLRTLLSVIWVLSLLRFLNVLTSDTPCVRLVPVKNNYYVADGFGQSLMRIYEVGRVVSSDLISIW